jgi:hypothetical protein
MLFVTGTALRNHAANIRPGCVTREILSGGEAMRLLTTLAQSFNLPEMLLSPRWKKENHVVIGGFNLLAGERRVRTAFIAAAP